MYQDETLVCKDCGQEFVFTAGEQEFYAERGFENTPLRCRDCRNARKNGGAVKRQQHDQQDTCHDLNGTEPHHARCAAEPLCELGWRL